VEQRRIPQVERLETRDVPSAPAVPYLLPPVHLDATSGFPSPQVVVGAPPAPFTASEVQVALDIRTPNAAGECGYQIAAVWPQAPDAVFSSFADPHEPTSAEGTPQQALRVGASAGDITAPARQVGETPDVVAAAAAPSTLPQGGTPTIEGVQRYAGRSVSRHRLDDPSDAVQQICLEWLQLAAMMATTYDDVRRIVARVIDRAYTRLGKQQRTAELFDVPARADAVQESFRDMQLDRDLNVKDLTDREWQVIELRRQGYTFAEIGVKMGMRKQRAREMFLVALSYLQVRYGA
jgi:hypothetical protein